MATKLVTLKDSTNTNILQPLTSNLGIYWNCTVKTQQWCNIGEFRVGNGNALIGNSYLINIRATRSNVVINNTYLINSCHNKSASISLLNSSTLQKFRNYKRGNGLRCNTDSHGNCYVNFFATGTPYESDNPNLSLAIHVIPLDGKAEIKPTTGGPVVEKTYPGDAGSNCNIVYDNFKLYDTDLQAGYTQLPCGILVQYGFIGVHQEPYQLTFPIPYTKLLGFYLTAMYNDEGSGMNLYIGNRVLKVNSKEAFICRQGSDTSLLPFYYLAIGYFE